MKKSTEQKNKSTKNKDNNNKKRQNKVRRGAHGETPQHLCHTNKANCQTQFRRDWGKSHWREWLNETQVWLPIKLRGQQTDSAGPGRKQEKLNRRTTNK